MRVLGGAALGLLLGVAIVLVVNVAYPAQSSRSLAVPGSAQTESVTSNATATTVYQAGAMNTPAYISRTSTSTSATYTQPTSPGVTSGVSTKTAPATSSVPATLIEVLPPIAIALVLGILVYQLSTRRIDSE